MLSVAFFIPARSIAFSPLLQATERFKGRGAAVCGVDGQTRNMEAHLLLVHDECQAFNG